MKIIEHLFNKSNGQSTIHLDLEGNLCIVYVTENGLQLLNPPNKELDTEEAHSIIRFIEEYLFTISEEEKLNLTNETKEQSGIQQESQATDPSGEVIKPTTQESAESGPKAEERREGENLGGKLEQAG